MASTLSENCTFWMPERAVASALVSLWPSHFSRCSLGRRITRTSLAVVSGLSGYNTTIVFSCLTPDSQSTSLLGTYTYVASPFSVSEGLAGKIATLFGCMALAKRCLFCVYSLGSMGAYFMAFFGKAVKVRRRGPSLIFVGYITPIAGSQGQDRKSVV